MVVKDQLTLEEAPVSRSEAQAPVVPAAVMRIDLHCHSQASHDCSTPLTSIPVRCRKRGIHVQAITDHNQIWGAQELKAMVESETESGQPALTIIVGEEVSTSEGEIIGLFLKEKIEEGLSPEDTVEQIIAQGGLVLLPHGFDPLKRWRLTPAALERVADAINIVEAFNARVSRATWNRVAAEWAQARRLPMSAGTDAHTIADIGVAWVEVPRSPVGSPAELLAALIGGKPSGLRTHPVKAYVYKLWDRTWRRVIAR
ncbi:MAG TPA: PHP domain-containing protein [Anaerolineales bacterium]|jgi:predicted metal-dependent phosphoesterase TrpH|nr:PHP domain-containing protein [Anaerolineales bacterium]